MSLRCGCIVQIHQMKRLSMDGIDGTVEIAVGKLLLVEIDSTLSHSLPTTTDIAHQSIAHLVDKAQSERFVGRDRKLFYDAVF